MGRQVYEDTPCTARTGYEDIKGPSSALQSIFILPKLNSAYVPSQASLSLHLLIGTQTSSKILQFIGNSKDIWRKEKKRPIFLQVKAQREQIINGTEEIFRDCSCQCLERFCTAYAKGDLGQSWKHSRDRAEGASVTSGQLLPKLSSVFHVSKS